MTEPRPPPFNVFLVKVFNFVIISVLLSNSSFNKDNIAVCFNSSFSNLGSVSISKILVNKLISFIFNLHSSSSLLLSIHFNKYLYHSFNFLFAAAAVTGGVFGSGGGGGGGGGGVDDIGGGCGPFVFINSSIFGIKILFNIALILLYLVLIQSIILRSYILSCKYFKGGDAFQAPVISGPNKILINLFIFKLFFKIAGGGLI